MGERPSVQMRMTWIKDGVEIPAGTMIGQHKLNSTASDEYAALHMILDDLVFAEDCFTEADKLGVPDATSTFSKALIHSGTVAYARCFKSGVRAVKLSADKFSSSFPGFDREAHDYLMALRDKHFAHSVNSFERSEAFGIVVAKPGERWREGNGVGVMLQTSIGLNRKMLRVIAMHVERMKVWIGADLAARRVPLYEEFKAILESGASVEMVPMVSIPDRAAVTARRK